MLPLYRQLAALALVSLYFIPQPRAELFANRVIEVLDGDTVDVQTTGGQPPRRVRLAAIDAPEKGQRFGIRAKEQLVKLVGGRIVVVDWYRRDRHGRLVGKLVLDGQDMNLAMVSGGYAWWDPHYALEQPLEDQALYEAAETRARAERRGLWADRAPMAPWDWRRRPKPTGSYAALLRETKGGGFASRRMDIPVVGGLPAETFARHPVAVPVERPHPAVRQVVPRLGAIGHLLAGVLSPARAARCG
jgi:endonuclease YncB( thermonuclease family)